MHSWIYGTFILALFVLTELVFISLLMKHRDEQGAKALILFLSLFILYDIAYAVEGAVSGTGVKQASFLIRYLVIAWMPFAELHVVNTYFNLRIGKRGLAYVLFLSISILFSVIILTNHLHFQFVSHLEFATGCWFSLNSFRSGMFLIALNFFRLAAGVIYLYFCFSIMYRERSIYRRRGLFMSFAVIIPLIAVFLAALNRDPYRFQYFPVAYFAGMIFPKYLYFTGTLFGPVPADNTAVMASLPDGVMILNRYDVLIDYNRKAAEYIPELRESFIGIHVDEIAEQSRFLARLKALTLDEEGSEVKGDSLSGETRWFEVRRVRQESVYHKDMSAIIIRDISPEIEMRERLHHAFSNQMEADMLKMMVIRVVSRNMHAPLMGLKSLRQLICSPMVSTYPQIWPRIEEEVDTLIESNDLLISNLLALNIMHDQDRAYPQVAIDLDSIMMSIYPPVNRIARKKGVVYSIDSEDILILGHPDLLKLVLRNVLENAVKYSYPGMHVSVSFQVNKSSLRIQVENDGVSIDSDTIRSHLDGLWGVTRMGTSGESGPGVGLYASRKFVERMTGSMSIQAKEEGGTRVVISLQRAFPNL